MSSSVNFWSNSEEEVEFVNFPETRISLDRAIAVEELHHFQVPASELSENVHQIAPRSLSKVGDVQLSFASRCSSCPSKPICIPPTHFYCGEMQFKALQEKVDQSLQQLNTFHFSYDEVAYVWRGKCINGSRFMEIAINCYWDSKKKDHLISVRKISGDMLNVSVKDVLDQLQTSFGVAIVARNMRCGMRVPSFHRTEISSTTGDCVLHSLDHILSMLQSSIIENHVEAGRILYDVLDNHASHTVWSDLSSVNVVREIFAMLLVKALSYSSEINEQLREFQTVMQQCVVMSLSSLYNKRSPLFGLLFPSNDQASKLLISALMILVVTEPSAGEYSTIAVRLETSRLLVGICRSSNFFFGASIPQWSIDCMQIKNQHLRDICLHELLPSMETSSSM